MIGKLKVLNETKEILSANDSNDVKDFSKSKLNTKTIADSNHSKQSSVKKELLYSVIGAKIAYYRTLRQLSQRELANKIHLSTSTLGRIERGKYNNGVSIATLLDIAEGLRIELSTLLTFSEEEKKVWWEIDKNII